MDTDTPQDAPSSPSSRSRSRCRGSSPARSSGCRRRPPWSLPRPSTLTGGEASVSTATRLAASSLSSASRIASLIWSAILSRMTLGHGLGGEQATARRISLCRRNLRGWLDVRASGSPGRRVSSVGCQWRAAAPPNPRRRRQVPPWDRRASTTDPSAPRTTAVLRVTSKARPSPTSLTTSRSEPFRGFLAGVRQHVRGLVSVSAAKPTTTCPGRSASTAPPGCPASS